MALGELAGVGGFFLFNFSIPMGIEFLIKKGSQVNFVNNLLKKFVKITYNLNNNKKRLTTTHIVLIKITTEENRTWQREQ